MERIDKIIASQGQFTRKEVKQMAAKGLIRVNGETIKKSDEKADPESAEIEIDGEPFYYQRHITLMINKPVGFTSVIEGNHHDCVTELIPEEYLREGLMPAGRLDREASGLVIITDDGELAHYILSPKKQVRKVYEITLDRPVTEKMVRRFADGILVGNEKKSMDLVITGENSCMVTTRDGRYFQIEKMFETFHARVLTLHRTGIVDLFLPDEMEAGECWELTEEEVRLLREQEDC